MMLKRPKPIEDDLAGAPFARRHRRAPEALREDARRAQGPVRPRPALHRPRSARDAPPSPAGTVAMSRALDPPFHDIRTWSTGRERKAAEQQAQRNLEALILAELELRELASETQAVHNDPERVEYFRIWNAYARSVQSVAKTKGNEAEFVRRFQDLMAERHDAEEYDDEAAVRSVEGRLLRLVGIPFPQLPDAAFEAAPDSARRRARRGTRQARAEVRGTHQRHHQRHRNQDLTPAPGNALDAGAQHPIGYRQ